MSGRQGKPRGVAEKEKIPKYRFGVVDPVRLEQCRRILNIELSQRGVLILQKEEEWVCGWRPSLDKMSAI